MPRDANPCFMQQGLKAALLSNPGGPPLPGGWLPAKSKHGYDILFSEKNALAIYCIIDGLPRAWPTIRMPLTVSSFRLLAACWALFSNISTGTCVLHPQHLAGP